MSCEEDLPEFSKDLVQQDLEKYIQIALLVSGGRFVAKLLQSVNQGLYLIFLFF